MADHHLILQTDGFDVDSRLTFIPTGAATSILRIDSSCQTHAHHIVLNIGHRTGYSKEQAEYDIEQARWISARAAAGKAHIRTLIPQILTPAAPSNTPRRLTQPEHPKPSPTISNTGTK